MFSVLPCVLCTAMLCVLTCVLCTAVCTTMCSVYQHVCVLLCVQFTNVCSVYYCVFSVLPCVRGITEGPPCMRALEKTMTCCPCIDWALEPVKNRNRNTHSTA